MRLYNTLTRKVEDFIPIEDNKVKIYTCGPTVYHFAHIGNLRTYVMEDILVRTLIASGYDVTRAMNITDVGHLSSDADEGEDKMVKGAKRENKSVYEIAQFYTDAFFKDCKDLKIKKPDAILKATECIDDYVEFIKVLEEKGYTYRAGGNIYFDISKADDYTKLSKLPLDQLQHGAREDVEVDVLKKHPSDFVLWFTKSKFEDQQMKWETPFGTGYPGWHLECSVIALKLLGDNIDIHCGGVDHIHTHHTNEIAQTEGYTGKHWVNYWWHSEFLIDNQGKMSKSKGDFLTLSLLKEKGYDPMVYRYYLLNGHYRKQQTFTFNALDNAKDAYNKLLEKTLSLDKPIESEKSLIYYNKFLSFMQDDLNTANGLTVVYDVLNDRDMSSGEKAYTILKIDEVLKLGLFDKEELEPEFIKKVEDLIALRLEAKRNRDYKRADELRDELNSMGITLKDTKDSTTWTKI